MSLTTDNNMHQPRVGHKRETSVLQSALNFFPPTCYASSVVSRRDGYTGLNFLTLNKAFLSTKRETKGCWEFILLHPSGQTDFCRPLQGQDKRAVYLSLC